MSTEEMAEPNAGRKPEGGRAIWPRLVLGALGLFWVGVILLLAS